MFSYNRLYGLMAEKGFTKCKLANAIGMSMNALTNKFKCRSSFSSREIAKICEVLQIPVEKIGYYFFVVAV